ncbi:putative hydrolase rbbp9 [Hyaloraphidium curvatum]|nr:putative hydrolase rbbp9 [Hyaloraphidium curvatum]
MPRRAGHSSPGGDALAKVVIVPGNGAGCIYFNFYEWLRDMLVAEVPGVTVNMKDMPDGDTARESIWLPFIEDVLGADDETILVGHSSGALAGLRLAERTELRGLVLVSVSTTDLDDENERASGYFDRPWDWAAVRRNVRHVVQFASTDDPFIPLELQREARDGLEAAGEAEGVLEGHEFEYIELEGKSHYFDEQQPEILEAVKKLIERVGGEDSS